MRVMHQRLQWTPGSDFLLHRTCALFSFKPIALNIIKYTFCTCVDNNIWVTCHAIVQRKPALKLLD